MTLLSLPPCLAEAGAAGHLLIPRASTAVGASGTGYAANQPRLVINQIAPPRAYSHSPEYIDGQMPKAVTRGWAVPCHDAGNNNHSCRQTREASLHLHYLIYSLRSPDE